MLGEKAFIEIFNKTYMEGQVNKMAENERAQELTEIARAWIDCCGAFIEGEDGKKELLQFDDISQIADDGNTLVRLGFSLDDLNDEIYAQVRRGYR